MTERIRRAPALRGRTPISLVLLATLTACGSSTPTPSTPSISAWKGPASTATVAGAAGEQLPLQQYMLMGRDRQSVARAHTILAQQCMDKQGFHLTLPQPAPETGSAQDLAARRYGIDSLEAAQQFGFKPEFDTPEVVAARQESERFTAQLTPAQQKALGGDPVNSTERFRQGCLGEADKKLMEGTSQTHFAGLGLSPLVRGVNLDPRATASPATSSALQAFATCMASAGYPEVTDPREAPKKYLNSSDVTPEEKKAAVAQFQCQESSGVTRAMRASEIAFQKAAIDANPEGFATVKAELATLVRHASEVTAHG